MACLKSSKKSSKTGDRFTAISDLQKNEEFFISGWELVAVESFQNKFIVPRFLKYSCLKGSGNFYFSLKKSLVARRVEFL